MQGFAPDVISPIDLKILIKCLLLSLVYAYILAQTFKHCSRVITDTNQFFGVFFVLIPLMILVISVVKSSLALSLGLVGALSIVRFRTPIKEPEELIYIFLAIGVGLGLGANQLEATSICFFFVIAIIVAESKLRKRSQVRGLYIDVEGKLGKGMNLETLSNSLKKKHPSLELRRYISSPDSKSFTFSVNVDVGQKLNELVESIESTIECKNLTVIDRNRQID